MKWKMLSTEEVYKTPWVRMRRDQVINHAGKELTYSIMELNHPGVSVVAVNADGKILLEKNYRYPIDKDSWEIPSGHSDGMDLLEAAKRELHEETGYESNDWVRLGTQYSLVGMANAQQEIFLARNVHRTGGNEEDLEDIQQVTFMSIDEINELIRTGEMFENIAITSVHMASLRGLTTGGKI